MLWQFWEHNYIYCIEVNYSQVIGKRGRGREGREEGEREKEKMREKERGECSIVTHRGENQSWKISLLTLFIFTGGNEVTGKREIILIH